MARPVNVNFREPLRISVDWKDEGKPPTVPENFAETNLARIKLAIRELFANELDSCDHLNCIDVCENARYLCWYGMGATLLYEQIHEEVDTHIAAEVESLVECQSPDFAVFLSHVGVCWQYHCGRLSLLHDTIGTELHHPRVIGIPTPPTVPKLWDTGLKLFRKHLSLSPAVEHRIVTALLGMIQKERSGEDVDKSLLDRVLKMFKDLGIYSESFEKAFLECTCQFYAAEGLEYMQQSSVPDYLKHVETRLHEEHERCSHYLDASTRKPLVAIAEKQLLGCHISALLDKGFTLLMDGSCIEDLQRMHSLLSRVNALESLRQALGSYIQRTGQGIVIGEEKDEEMAASLVKLKSSVDHIWEKSFAKNLDFGKTIENAFEHLQGN